MKQHNGESDLFDLKQVFSFFERYWLVIGISMILSLAIAFIITKYSAKKYRVLTSIVINEESTGLANASAQLMQEIGFVSSTKTFSNEMLVLKSTPLVKDALRKLDFQISYFEKDLLSQKELYKSSPFIVIMDKNFPQPIGVNFYVDFMEDNTFKLKVKAKKVSVYSFITKSIVQEVEGVEFEEYAEFDAFLSSDIMRFKILKNSSFDYNELKGRKFFFRINNQRNLMKSYRSRLEIVPPDIESTVAEIRLESYTPEKDIDFLNSLISSYIELDLDRKRITSIKTINYINNQLNIVGDSLERVEQSLQVFRSQNDVTDLSLQSGQFFEEMRGLENQKAILEVNQKYYDYIKDYFSANQDQFDELIAPSAMGIEDPMLNNLIEELIRLNGERASFIENNQAKSPYLKKINIRFENLRKMVAENIAYYKQNNTIALDDINSRIWKLNKELKKLPSTQRQLVGIERKFNINDAIYTYLLEKRAEAEIAKASYQADTEIVEPADVAGFGPISPNPTLNYFLALILGFIFPIGVIRLISILQTSVSDLNEVERLVSLPVLAKVSNNNLSKNNVIIETPNSFIAENFRHLRAGLRYYFNGEGTRCVMFSSAISGEGKSFIALNTAWVLANSKKKVILLNFDLRKNTDRVNGENKSGLTEFLSKQVSLEKIIKKTENENLDVIYQGSIAPNAGELITSKETSELLLYLKKEYDYVIIDTPPLRIVSDAYVLMEYVDLNVCVLRIKKTPKDEFLLLQEEIKEKGVRTCLVVNDVVSKVKNKYGTSYYGR